MHIFVTHSILELTEYFKYYQLSKNVRDPWFISVPIMMLFIHIQPINVNKQLKINNPFIMSYVMLPAALHIFSLGSGHALYLQQPLITVEYAWYPRLIFIWKNLKEFLLTDVGRQKEEK